MYETVDFILTNDDEVGQESDEKVPVRLSNAYLSPFKYKGHFYDNSCSIAPYITSLGKKPVLGSCQQYIDVYRKDDKGTWWSQLKDCPVKHVFNYKTEKCEKVNQLPVGCVLDLHCGNSFIKPGDIYKVDEVVIAGANNIEKVSYDLDKHEDGGFIFNKVYYDKTCVPQIKIGEFAVDMEYCNVYYSVAKERNGKTYLRKHACPDGLTFDVEFEECVPHDFKSCIRNVGCP